MGKWTPLGGPPVRCIRCRACRTKKRRVTIFPAAGAGKRRTFGTFENGSPPIDHIAGSAGATMSVGHSAAWQGDLPNFLLRSPPVRPAEIPKRFSSSLLPPSFVSGRCTAVFIQGFGVKRPDRPQRPPSLSSAMLAERTNPGPIDAGAPASAASRSATIQSQPLRLKIQNGTITLATIRPIANG